MSTFRRRLGVCVCLTLLVGGCKSLFLLPFYLTSEEPKIPAELHKLADKDKKKAVKVVILTYTGLETRPEFLHADRELSRLFAVQLQKLCKDNNENVTVINPLKVEEFKNTHPDWSSSHLDREAVGKHFKADYVISLDISELSLYQPNTANQFYQGRANVQISLVNVHNPDDFTIENRVLPFTYPPENQGGNRLVDSDTPPQAFRVEFLNALARRLTWYFADRPTQDNMMGQ